MDTVDAEKIVNHLHCQELPQKDCISPSRSQLNGFSWGSIRNWERLITGNNMFKQLEPHCSRGSPLTGFSRFENNSHRTFSTRNWLVQLWLEGGRLQNSRLTKIPRVPQKVEKKEFALKNHLLLFSLSSMWFGSSTVAGERFDDSEKSLMQQLSPSQSCGNILQPTSPEEMKVQPLLARDDLLLTRGIKWANLILGFEQENHYAIVDACYPQSPLGFIHEQSNVVLRQLFPMNRPFIACVTDVMGNELFRVQRPVWFMNSTTYAEINGRKIGMVRRRWHPWRRLYDLYLGKEQFAVADNPGFWNWTFTLKDNDRNVLARIDRKWRGVLFELFTDAGQYVVQFGHPDPISKNGASCSIKEIEGSRPLTTLERVITLTLALSLDYDTFSGISKEKSFNEVVLKKGFRSCLMEKLISLV